MRPCTGGSSPVITRARVDFAAARFPHQGHGPAAVNLQVDIFEDVVHAGIAGRDVIDFQNHIFFQISIALSLFK
jgi:hypothetical protein